MYVYIYESRGRKLRKEKNKEKSEGRKEIKEGRS
jgi:hypothetical protein